MFHVKQFYNFSENVIKKFKIYQQILEKWQSKINLVSQSTLKDIFKRHFLDSAQLYPLIPKDAQNLLDLGSGAGFPALILAILSQENSLPWSVIAIESDQRKCCFMSEVARLCEVKMDIQNQRIEQVRGIKADVITARALADLKSLLDYSLPFIHKKSQLFFLKGQNIQSEIQEALEKYDFSYHLFQSQTDEKGQIIQIEQLKVKDKK